MDVSTQEMINIKIEIGTHMLECWGRFLSDGVPTGAGDDGSLFMQAESMEIEIIEGKLVDSVTGGELEITPGRYRLDQHGFAAL